MKRISLAFLMTWIATAWLGCDSVAPPETAEPAIRLTFVEPTVLSGAPAAKSGDRSARINAFLVTVDIISESGENFGPLTATVDEGDSEVRFPRSLPTEDTYTFSVRFEDSDTGAAVAEGRSLYYVRANTREVEVPIVLFDPEASTIGFIPGRVSTTTTGDPILLTLRYYGNGIPTAGLAFVMDVTGLDPALLTLDGATLFQVTGQQLQAAWAWDEPVSGQLDLATLSIPRTQAADLRIAITEGNLRTVNPDGAVSRLQATGVRVEITP